jgi:protein-S-isoprenylcysteine O-methyltransferase Ste14
MGVGSMVLLAKALWLLGIVSWCVIRYPFERKAKRVRVVVNERSMAERAGLIAATLGLGIIPAIYVASGFPSVAEYPARPLPIALGAVVYATAMWLFRRSHKDLGRNWSISLEIRDQHRLVSNGIYRLIRHPMYTAFWLMGLGQALLLPNWVAGGAGLVGFGVLYFLRIDHEERMMIQTFGDEYRSYMTRTKRIIPLVY